MKRKLPVAEGCSWGHPWTAENTYVYVKRDGREMKICRACRKERMRLYRSEGKDGAQAQ